MQAPVLTVTSPDRDPAAGDILTTNGPGPGQYGPLIYTPQGRLVWFDRLTGGETAENLSEQTFQGRRVLTWWKGRVLALGFGQGEDLVMNTGYQTIARVSGGNGLKADLHDFQIAGGDVAYITAYNPIRCDLSAVKGSADGSIVDAAVQEIDMRTGLVRWEWHSLDHVAVSESETETPTGTTPWDWFHLNSIDPEPDGNILISARSTWAGYQLQHGTGVVLWRLGGLKSSFKMGPGTEMAWQHDGRVLADGELTFFDDGSNPPIHHQSRGLRIIAGPRDPPSPPGLRIHPSEPAAAGREPGQHADARRRERPAWGTAGCPRSPSSARPGRCSWTRTCRTTCPSTGPSASRGAGRPASPPAVLASLNNTAEETIVHASWNGAGDVAAWRVLAGSGAPSLTALATIPDTGFESSVTLPEKYAVVQVQALGSAGQVLGNLAAGARGQLRLLAPRRGRAVSRPVSSSACGSSSVVVPAGEDLVEEDPPSLPQPASATVATSAAMVVSMAVSGVFLMGRSPDLARTVGRSP